METGRKPMDNSRLMRRRILLGRICILAFIIALAGVFDALVASKRKPANHLDLIAGQSLELTGDVYGKVNTAGEIDVVCDSPGLTLQFEKDLFSGYWLGLKMWRARLTAGSTLQPGQYNMNIIYHDLSEIKPDKIKKVQERLKYTITVYGDANALRQGDLSMIKRFTGVSPWLIAIVFFLLVPGSGAWIFVISGQIDSEMARHGFAEIYRVIRHAGGVEVFFGLGRIHGLEPGEKMYLFNESGDLVTEIAVDNIGNENSSAVIPMAGICSGCTVARNPAC